MKAIKQYWSQCQPREQVMLLCAGIFLVSFIFYEGLYLPLSTRVTQSKAQLLEDKATLSFMKEAWRQYTTTKTTQQLTQSQLLTMLGDQLNKTSFQQYPYQLQQTGGGDIQLSYDAVPYNAFITWLWRLSKQYHFSIKQLNAERTKTPGVIKASVVISV